MDTGLMVLTGSASALLGADVCRVLELAPVACETWHFPDGELQVELEQSVRGSDVFLVQATSPPVDRHLIELLMLADACRRARGRRRCGNQRLRSTDPRRRAYDCD